MKLQVPHLGEGGSCSANWWLGQYDQRWLCLTRLTVPRTTNPIYFNIKSWTKQCVLVGVPLVVSPPPPSDKQTTWQLGNFVGKFGKKSLFSKYPFHASLVSAVRSPLYTWPGCCKLLLLILLLLLSLHMFLFILLLLLPLHLQQLLHMLLPLLQLMCLCFYFCF